MVTMNGLRVYTNPATEEIAIDDDVFYSRRGNGPYYRWRYEEKVGQWRVSRVIAKEFTPQKLSLASWKIVPEALQTRMGEHYLD